MRVTPSTSAHHKLCTVEKATQGATLSPTVPITLEIFSSSLPLCIAISHLANLDSCMKTCRVKLVLELKHSLPVTKQMLVHLCYSATVLPHHGAFFISSSCMLVGGKIFEGDRIQNKKIPLPVLSPEVFATNS